MIESFPAELMQRMMIKVCSFIWVSFRHLIEHLVGLIPFRAYYDYVCESCTADLVEKKMVQFCGFLWVLVCDSVLSSSRHLIKHLAGSKFDDDHGKNFDKSLVFDEQEDQFIRSLSDSGYSIFDDQKDRIIRRISDTDSVISDGLGEEEKSEFTFGFQYQMKEEDLISYNDNKGVNDVKTGETGEVFMNTSKYEFVPVQDIGGFVVEPKAGNFTVHEVFVEEGLKDDVFTIKEKRKSQDFDEVEVKEEAKIEVEQKDLNESSRLLSNVKVDDIMDAEVSLSPNLQRVVEFSDIVEETSEESAVDDSGCEEVQDLQEKSERNSGGNEDLKPDQVNWLGDFFMRNDSFCHGYDISEEVVSDSPDHHLESEGSSGFFSISPQNVKSVDEQELESLIPPVQEEADDDYVEFEPNLLKEKHNSDSSKHELDSGFDNSMEPENDMMEGTEYEEEGEVNIKSWDFDSDEEDDADVLLEHQELIGQMKMELKNARTGGLPTILEESETPRVNEDLKPLKINEKLEHRDLLAEIQKFYKSYTEKMRKLDVLNYQTLQAINFLRMKHPEQMSTGENASLSAIKSVLLPSLWPCKLRRIYADPTLKSITELHKDLEIVYVGQACLSWEILHWQYKKAKELQLYDPQGYRSYNQIAIEFQQFHVLLRRFTEDELFQGPRVLNYTKQRCTFRGLLQVPAIRDDNLKEKKARKEEEEDAVSISTMAKMIKESMTVFWEFLHTDKDTTNLFLTIILQGSKAHLQDPADSELFMDIKTIHQKKDRRLKDMLRTGNCIVKKFQKHQETVMDQHMFVSQVELRLVSRVLSLPRLTRDQLLWCQSKLNNIKFIDRKIQVEDSLFLLFPC
uniref:uncharacterized protein LOC122585545 n=1 Tax=Erigeron canadensis TaxID=72917 RepID=UPI001CB9AF6C|nr:uncharacterized protein LOC122585545 [Erigeron canadensis]